MKKCIYSFHCKINMTQVRKKKNLPKISLFCWLVTAVLGEWVCAEIHDFLIYFYSPSHSPKFWTICWWQLIGDIHKSMISNVCHIIDPLLNSSCSHFSQVCWTELIPRGKNKPFDTERQLSSNVLSCGYCSKLTARQKINDANKTNPNLLQEDRCLWCD